MASSGRRRIDDPRTLRNSTSPQCCSAIEHLRQIFGDRRILYPLCQIHTKPVNCASFSTPPQAIIDSWQQRIHPYSSQHIDVVSERNEPTLQYFIVPSLPPPSQPLVACHCWCMSRVGQCSNAIVQRSTGSVNGFTAESSFEQFRLRLPVPEHDAKEGSLQPRQMVTPRLFRLWQVLICSG